MSKLSKLTEIQNIREIWKHEAYDFTKWLSQEENLQILSDELGIIIINPETEVSVGGFSVDIKAETEDGGVVTIENQLETTNHTHLGQIITYASGLKARYIIWLVTNAREEHREALDWLNQNTNDEINFFLLEIKVYQIDNSLPAPKFEIVCKPNNWQKTVKKITLGELAPRHIKNIEFWEKFFSFAGNKYAHRIPTKNHWISISTGSSRVRIHLNSTSNEKKASINIQFLDRDMYDKFILNKEKIANDLDNNCWWLTVEKSAYLGCHFEYSVMDQDKWEDIFVWYLKMIEVYNLLLVKYLK